ncbi:hypothetical protein DCAR_0934805 [Daucus carota subsp. sativus]|uniref:Uncharacterized protein n=1 Tax=Daucus carota subsp. sativus TaxID=79200 RepID=A0AAF0XVW5_DAUCS|nr:hypothetical protein DCAR_0934805 [Daucus carota subsp. sativus]
MGKPKREFQSSVPWRGDMEEDACNELKLLVTSDESGSTMHLHHNNTKNNDVSLTRFDSQLSYAFRRNYQFLQNVFSIETLVKPLPPPMAENVARNLSFFRRIFTQFSEPEGISKAQKSLGLGREEKYRQVR